MHLMKDLYMVCGFPYAVHTNVYIIRGPEGLVMVDTGTNPKELEVIEKHMAEWDLKLSDVTDVLITHCHMDHGGNAKLLRDMGARIIIGDADADPVEQGGDRIIDYALMETYTPCPVDLRVTDGMVFNAGGMTFDVLHVPGHTDGSVFYRVELEGKKVVFTGDTIRVSTNCSDAILGWTGGPDSNLPVYIQSMSRAARYECDVVCGGHYQMCMQEGWRILQLAYKKALEDFRIPKNII